MERIRSADVLPSGYEVESASSHPLVSGLKERVMSKVTDVRRAANRKARLVETMAGSSVTAAKQQVRGNPAKWAGIAAGAGLGIGLLGRYLRHRSKHHHIPNLVIIEAC
jgi:ElaB/YqjD/DUF883 family membrane-anchored ribosome-binding protein